MKRAIATVCLSGTLPDKIEAAAAAGFDGVEIFEHDLLTFGGTAQEAGAMAREAGLSLDLFQPFRDFEAMPEPQRSRNLDRAERKFDTMQALGARMVLVCSNVQPHAIDDPARAAADLHEMAERAQRRGLAIGYEALAWGTHVRRLRQAWEIVRAANHPALGLILDSFHTLSLGDDLSGLAESVPAEKLFFLQLADAPRMAMDVLSWSRHHRCFPGQGELPVTAFLREVMRAGYAGPLSLEVFNDEFRGAPSRRTARDALCSLIWLEEQAGLATLPALPLLEGFEFVEFAVDQEARAALGRFATRIGFRKAGAHRSKDVELWRNGGASLVFNAEPDSAAAERFALSGPSVCALALRVDDPGRAIARAEALRCSIWRERRAEGESELPGIRAPDGLLIHLVKDAAWEQDFVLEAGAGGALLGVDHVAQAVTPDLVDSLALFLRAVFGLEPEPLLELPDPYGLIRSRAFSDAAKRVRMPVNVSESPRTSTGRFVSTTASAGVHHLAFACADLFAALADAPPLLAIPANYYEDLEGRLGLQATELARLASRQFLLDRDAEGRVFRHAYTPAFRSRFFLEVLQRDPGYQGYGAVNAPVRMAAQRAMPPAGWN
jgi:4-hydroxyphenylpyruvate dioxygenase